MTVMHKLAARLIRVRPVLRGLRLTCEDAGHLRIEMRVAGHSRWAIQGDARKLIIMFLRRVFILPADLKLEQVTTERNGRDLYLGEGRTQMTRRPRAERQADGTPWDDYEWWGDELPILDDEDSDSATPHESSPEASRQSSVPGE